VYNDGFTVKEAAAELNIKYGTAKTIIRVFKTTGRVDRIVKSG
jgi:transposase